MTRLMCSKHESEVGLIRDELLKAGIRTEVRCNPLAAALKVTRLELWLENERDFSLASELCAKLQAGEKIPETEPPSRHDGDGYIDVDILPTQSTSLIRRGRTAPEPAMESELPADELEEASLALEKEIEDFIEREEALSKNCAVLRSQVENLTRSLSDAKSSADKKTAELSAAKAALERELADRTASEEQLKSEVRKLQAQLRSATDTLGQRQQKFDLAQQQLQTQQVAVVELRKELVLREQDSVEDKKLVSKARAELSLEREARLAAERRAEQSTQAQQRLENQLASQRDLQKQLRSSIGSLNSLRGKLQAKKGSL